MIPLSSFPPAAADNPATADNPAIVDNPVIVDNPSTADNSPAVIDNLIREEPLDLVGLLRQAHHPGAGAVVLFSGEVRDTNKGRPVAWLEYESHRPLAAKMMEEILLEARKKWQLHIAIAQHRVGRVMIGETAVVVITAAAHRSEAYAANQYIIDRIKHEAPIWKCEYYTDGSHEWGNNCNCS